MRFVHTSDWQLAKTLRLADEACRAPRNGRPDAANRVRHLARAKPGHVAAQKVMAMTTLRTAFKLATVRMRPPQRSDVSICLPV
jgi:hypothetical protein